ESSQTETIPIQEQASGTTSTTTGHTPGLYPDQNVKIAESYIGSTDKNNRANDIAEKAAKVSDINHDTQPNSKAASGEIKLPAAAVVSKNNNYTGSGTEKQTTYHTGLAGLR